MTRKTSLAAFALTVAALLLATGPAFAHHVMDGQMPADFASGFLSGLGHPVIGLDHFAAVVAVGCLAAAHRAGVALALGFVVAMVAGVALHMQGLSMPGTEALVALTVIALGTLMLRRKALPAAAALAVFALAGLLHGYALGESIYGAERTPLYAYLAGLTVIQSAIALAALNVTRMLVQKNAEPAGLRLLGAGVAGVGLAIFVQQVVPAA
jgi:urease accessory protein